MYNKLVKFLFCSDRLGLWKYLKNKIKQNSKIRNDSSWKYGVWWYGWVTRNNMVENNINNNLNATSMLRLLCSFCHNYTVQLKQNGASLSSDVKSFSVVPQNWYFIIWGKVLSVLRHVLLFLKSPLWPRLQHEFNASTLFTTVSTATTGSQCMMVWNKMQAETPERFASVNQWGARTH